MKSSFQIKDKTIYTKYTFDLPYNVALKERSKLLRKAGVLSEVLFWKQVYRK